MTSFLRPVAPRSRACGACVVRRTRRSKPRVEALAACGHRLWKMSDRDERDPKTEEDAASAISCRHVAGTKLQTTVTSPSAKRRTGEPSSLEKKRTFSVFPRRVRHKGSSEARDRARTRGARRARSIEAKGRTAAAARARAQRPRMGRRRTGVFVSLKTALATAGAMGGVPGSPTPPCGSPLGTRCVAISGISEIRSSG